MNILENFYIQQHYRKGTLMNEQHPGEENPLFKIINPTTHNMHVHNPMQVSMTKPLQHEPTQVTTQPAGADHNTGHVAT
jgi:hypothetical protein